MTNHRDLISKHLEKSKTDLIDRLCTVVMERIFENMYTLHPRRLNELATEDFETFQHYISSDDLSAVGRLAQSRVDEGLGFSALLSVGTLLRKFSLEALDGNNGLPVTDVIEAVDRYINAYFISFLGAREKQILLEQERTHRAFIASMEK